VRSNNTLNTDRQQASGRLHTSCQKPPTEYSYVPTGDRRGNDLVSDFELSTESAYWMRLMPNKRLQPTLGSPRAAEARRWMSE
jgi:hypothetical protein